VPYHLNCFKTEKVIKMTQTNPPLMAVLKRIQDGKRRDLCWLFGFYNAHICKPF